MKKLLTINIISVFPNLFLEHLKNKPFSKAIQLGVLNVNLINLRDFALDSYGTIDDKPYGGGTGMVLRPEPIVEALRTIFKDAVDTPEKIKSDEKNPVWVMAPSGVTWNQKLANQSLDLDSITLICGRYEGIDQRILDLYASKVISIGNYVLSGGELPALVVMESLCRLIPSVLEKEEAHQKESFSDGTNIEHPQFTRPEEFKGQKVPDVLLSGNHKLIEDWKKSNSH